MEAARAGQKSITGTGADLRKLGMHEARLRLLEMSREMNLGLDDDTISSDFLIFQKIQFMCCMCLCLALSYTLEAILSPERNHLVGFGCN